MSLAFAKYSAMSSRFPRVSGDEPDKEQWESIAQWFSPRERG